MRSFSKLCMVRSISSPRSRRASNLTVRPMMPKAPADGITSPSGSPVFKYMGFGLRCQQNTASSRSRATFHALRMMRSIASDSVMRRTLRPTKQFTPLRSSSIMQTSPSMLSRIQLRMWAMFLSGGCSASLAPVPAMAFAYWSRSDSSTQIVAVGSSERSRSMLPARALEGTTTVRSLAIDHRYHLLRIDRAAEPDLPPADKRRHVALLDAELLAEPLPIHRVAREHDDVIVMLEGLQLHFGWTAGVILRQARTAGGVAILRGDFIEPERLVQVRHCRLDLGDDRIDVRGEMALYPGVVGCEVRGSLGVGVPIDDTNRKLVITVDEPGRVREEHRP